MEKTYIISVIKGDDMRQISDGGNLQDVADTVLFLRQCVAPDVRIVVWSFSSDARGFFSTEVVDIDRL